MNGTVSECACPLDGRTYLYVGKGVNTRQRVQASIFGSSSRPFRPEWMEEFSEFPHGHLVHFEAWYLPKNRIAVVEDVLIDLLRPRFNRRQTSGGFADHSLWRWTIPDVGGLADDVVIAHCNKDQRGLARSPLKNLPGVYAFYVDPGGETLSAYQVAMSMPWFRSMARGALDASLRARASSARLASRFLKSQFGKRAGPLPVEEAYGLGPTLGFRHESGTQ